jgi:CHAT domain-containing protein/tetratricopeptide (TPR) repeat protein
MHRVAFFLTATGIFMLLCPHYARSRNLTGDLVSARPVPARSRPARTDETEIARLNSLRRRAQEEVAQAAALEKRQTAVGFARAVSLLKNSAQLFEAGRWSAHAADAYIEIGDIYFVEALYPRALEFYGKARQAAGDAPGPLCRALAHSARTYANIGHSSEADSYSQQALASCDGVSSARARAEAWEARGEFLYWSGHDKDSVTPFSRARDLFVEAMDADGEALTLLRLSQAHYRTNPRDSLPLVKKALEIWRGLGNQYGQAEARAFLAAYKALNGEYESARCNAEKARRIFARTKDYDSEATALNTLGFIDMQTGDAGRSWKDYQQARVAFARAQDWPGEAEAISGLRTAAVALGSRPQQLLALFDAKLRLSQKTGNRNFLASAHGDLAGIQEIQNQYEQAEKSYSRAINEYHDAGNPLGEGKFLIRLAHLYVQEEKYADAISRLDLARPLEEKAGQAEELARLDYELARVYRGQNRLDNALQAIKRTVDIIESERVTIGDFDSRASYFASVHEYYRLNIQLLMLQHDSNRQLPLLVKAFEASEKSKVRSLLDWLSDPEGKVSCDEVLKREDALADSSPISLANSPARYAVPATSALSLNQIQELIGGDDAILLEYALGDEKSYLWILDGQQITVHELPSAHELNDAVVGLLRAATPQLGDAPETNDQFRKRMQGAAKEYEKYVEELSGWLLGPISSAPVRRIIVVPEGILQYLPFAALRVPSGNGEEILPTRHEIIVLPSGSALSALRTAAARRPASSSGAAVFADPVYEADDPRVENAGAQPAPKNVLPPLPWRDVQPGAKRIRRLRASHQEAVAVRSLGKDTYVAEGFRANRRAVLSPALGKYRLIHFAMHAVLDPKRPERSGLILSLVNRNGSSQNGYVYLRDIYDLRLSAELVVLSSCESGLGREFSSEGIIGLPRGFLRAGASSVIATLWKVEDAATAELMTRFYDRIRRGDRPALALARAQVSLSQSEQWSHPYYWAGFVFQGEYR